MCQSFRGTSNWSSKYPMYVSECHKIQEKMVDWVSLEPRLDRKGGFRVQLWWKICEVCRFLGCKIHTFPILVNTLDRTQTKRDECRAKGHMLMKVYYEAPWFKKKCITSTSFRRNVPKHVRNTLLYHQDEPIRPSCQMGSISGHFVILGVFWLQVAVKDSWEASQAMARRHPSFAEPPDSCGEIVLPPWST